MYKITYTGDGVATEFLFAFPFFQVADVVVIVDDVTVAETKYSVVPNQDFTGGTVIFEAPPEKGARIDIIRRISLSRVIDYQPTAKIDPEDLNTDFNFLLAAFMDLRRVEIDLSEWSNTHNRIVQFLEYTNEVITDKLGGGGVLGLYNNLLSVLSGALPLLINDYGSVADSADAATNDDYGLL